jgi:hypothetical protein
MSTPEMLDVIALSTPAGYLRSYSSEVLLLAAEENHSRKRDWLLVSVMSMTLACLVEHANIFQLEDGCDPADLREFSDELDVVYPGHHLIDFKGRASDGHHVVGRGLSLKECYSAHPVAVAQAAILSNVSLAGPLYEMFWYHLSRQLWQGRHLGISHNCGRALASWIAPDDYRLRGGEMVQICFAVTPDQSF